MWRHQLYCRNGTGSESGERGRRGHNPDQQRRDHALQAVAEADGEGDQDHGGNQR